MTYEVFIHGLQVYGFVGVSAEERAVGHRLRVDITMRVLGSADETDEVSETADYGDMARQAAAVIAQRPCKTLERQARLIGERLLEHFPLAESVVVEIAKIAPPFEEVAGSAGVKLTLPRART
jgi:dihydroneopterin aldolase